MYTKQTTRQLRDLARKTDETVVRLSRIAAGIEQPGCALSSDAAAALLTDARRRAQEIGTELLSRGVLLPARH